MSGAVENAAPRAAYRRQATAPGVDLFLDANEGPRVCAPAELELGSLNHYPSASELEAELAARFGVAPERVLVTAGADDALMRVMLAWLGPGDEVVAPRPVFTMIPRYAALVGGAVRGVVDGGAFPTAGVLAAIQTAGPRLGATLIVSPSNPTGSVASVEDLARVAAASPRPVVCDLAYAEFADVDLTGAALELPNAVCVRTFSKAWGLASARVGYAIGPEARIAELRAAGNPFAVGGPSLALARRRMAEGVDEVAAYVERVRVERVQLAAHLQERGASPWPSQANFVLATFPDPGAVVEGLAARGIAVRGFPNAGAESALEAPLARCVRITCPGNERDFARLTIALEEVLP